MDPYLQCGVRAKNLLDGFKTQDSSSLRAVPISVSVCVYVFVCEGIRPHEENSHEFRSLRTNARAHTHTRTHTYSSPVLLFTE